MKVRNAKSICDAIIKRKGLAASYNGNISKDDDVFEFMEVYHPEGDYFGSVIMFKEDLFEASECFYKNIRGEQQINIFGYRRTLRGALNFLLQGNTTENGRIPMEIYV